MDYALSSAAFEAKRIKALDFRSLVTERTQELLTIEEAAQNFLTATAGHNVFVFHGAMGAGKTTFIRALCREIGVSEPVTSPSFAIINEYSSPSGPIYHFDLYRLRRPEEALDIGLEDYLLSGRPCLMEWPELIESLLPEDTIHVHITENPDGSRNLRF